MVNLVAAATSAIARHSRLAVVLTTIWLVMPEAGAPEQTGLGGSVEARLSSPAAAHPLAATARPLAATRQRALPAVLQSTAVPVPLEAFVYLPVTNQADPLLSAVIGRTMELEGRMLAWDWEAGVALVGLLSVADDAGGEQAVDYAERWVYARISEGETFIGSDRQPPPCGTKAWPGPGLWHPNHATPAWPALMLYERRPREELRQIVASAVEFLRHDACRVEGAIAHVPGQVWDDTLIVSVPLLARYGALTDDQELFDLAAQQVLVHAQLLQDETTGLWYHGWRSGPGDHMSGAFWARGNGWAALATTELLTWLPDDHPDREPIRTRLVAQLDGLIDYQDASGMWRTVVNRPDYYLETSGSAAVAAAILRAVEFGWVDAEDSDRFEEAGLRALRAVRGRVAPDGSVTKVSAGTGVGDTMEDYAHIRTDLTQPYGQGLFLLMSSVGAHK